MANDQENKSEENSRQIVISPEDCNAALDFWRHFQIPIPPELQAAMDAFTADQSWENQQRVKLHITGTIATSTHEAFQDEMFKKIVEECSAVNYDMQFDRDLEDTVTVKE